MLRFRPGQRVPNKLQLAGGSFEIHGIETSIFEQLNPTQRRTKQYVERLPIPRLPQRMREAFRGVSKKTDDRHSGQQSALEKNESRVEMSNDGPLDLANFLSDGNFPPEEWQRGRIMAEEENALIERKTFEEFSNLM